MTISPHHILKSPPYKMHKPHYKTAMTYTNLPDRFSGRTLTLDFLYCLIRSPYRPYNFLNDDDKRSLPYTEECLKFKFRKSDKFWRAWSKHWIIFTGYYVHTPYSRLEVYNGWSLYGSVSIHHILHIPLSDQPDSAVALASQH